MALGGLIGSTAAAFLTENYEPRYCFAFSSGMGLVIAAVAVRLNVALETEGLEAQEGSELGFWGDFKRNCREVREAFQIPEFYRMILYLVVTGLLNDIFSLPPA